VGGRELADPDPARDWMSERDFGGTRFLGENKSTRANCLRMVCPGVNVLVNSSVTRLRMPNGVCDEQAKSKSFQLESLILAQNERWRQA
jgi:hypothetical protein